MFFISQCGFELLSSFPGGSDGKESTCMQETRVWSLSWEDPLEEGMATCSCIFAWKILWKEEPGRLQSMGSQTVGHDWVTNTHTSALLFQPEGLPLACIVGRSASHKLFQFLFPCNGWISSSFLMDSFAGYRIFGWQVFPFSTLNILSYFLLASIVSEESQLLILLMSPWMWRAVFLFLL